MYFIWFAGLAVVCYSALANLQLRPAGWLDRLVQYQKQQFIRDVNEVAPVQINAFIQPRPKGYVDSTAWDFQSVSHLLDLIEGSPKTGAVRGALRRMLQPSRRFMSRPKSFKHFPSLSQNIANYFYYQFESHEMSFEDYNSTNVVDENSVLVISNPVEARLPSSQISVKLLKEILETRASAARIMPKTTRVTMKWITHGTTLSSVTAKNDSTVAEDATDISGGNATTVGGPQDTTNTEDVGDAGGD